MTENFLVQLRSSTRNRGRGGSRQEVQLPQQYYADLDALTREEGASPIILRNAGVYTTYNLKRWSFYLTEISFVIKGFKEKISQNLFALPENKRIEALKEVFEELNKASMLSRNKYSRCQALLNRYGALEMLLDHWALVCNNNQVEFPQWRHLALCTSFRNAILQLISDLDGATDKETLSYWKLPVISLVYDDVDKGDTGAISHYADVKTWISDNFGALSRTTGKFSRDGNFTSQCDFKQSNVAFTAYSTSPLLWKCAPNIVEIRKGFKRLGSVVAAGELVDQYRELLKKHTYNRKLSQLHTEYAGIFTAKLVSLAQSLLDLADSKIESYSERYFEAVGEKAQLRVCEKICEEARNIALSCAYVYEKDMGYKGPFYYTTSHADVFGRINNIRAFQMLLKRKATALEAHTLVNIPFDDVARFAHSISDNEVKIPRLQNFVQQQPQQEKKNDMMGAFLSGFGQQNVPTRSVQGFNQQNNQNQSQNQLNQVQGFTPGPYSKPQPFNQQFLSFENNQFSGQNSGAQQGIYDSNKWQPTTGSFATHAFGHIDPNLTPNPDASQQGSQSQNQASNQQPQQNQQNQQTQQAPDPQVSAVKKTLQSLDETKAPGKDGKIDVSGERPVGKPIWPAVPKSENKQVQGLLESLHGLNLKDDFSAPKEDTRKGDLNQSKSPNQRKGTVSVRPRQGGRGRNN